MPGETLLNEITKKVSPIEEPLIAKDDLEAGG
jgi:hypothetical protein